MGPAREVTRQPLKCWFVEAEKGISGGPNGQKKKRNLNENTPMENKGKRNGKINGDVENQMDDVFKEELTNISTVRRAVGADRTIQLQRRFRLALPRP